MEDDDEEFNSEEDFSINARKLYQAKKGKENKVKNELKVSLRVEKRKRSKTNLSVKDKINKIVTLSIL